MTYLIVLELVIVPFYLTYTINKVLTNNNNNNINNNNSNK